MSVLRGNYPAKAITLPAKDNSAEKKFEIEALKRLGGSVAFVAKRKVIWALPQK